MPRNVTTSANHANAKNMSIPTCGGGGGSTISGNAIAALTATQIDPPYARRSARRRSDSQMPAKMPTEAVTVAVAMIIAQPRSKNQTSTANSVVAASNGN